MGRMDQHTRAFIHCQQMIILIKNRQRAILGRVVGLFLIQHGSDHVTGLHREVIMLGYPIDENLLLPFQTVDKTRRHFHFLFQERG